MFWFQIYIFFCMICSLAFMNSNFDVCFSLYISPKICSLMWQCWIFWWVLASVNELQFHSCFVFVSLYTCCLWIYRILIHMSLNWWLLLHTHTMFIALNVLKNWIVNLFIFLAIYCILIPWFFSKVWNFSRIKIVTHFWFCILDPVMSEWTVDVDRRIYKGIQMGMDRGFIQKGDPVIIITGWKPGSGSTNTMRIINAVDVANKDLLAPITGECLRPEMIHNEWCRSITMN